MKNQTKIALVGAISTALLASSAFAATTTTIATTSTTDTTKTPVVKVQVKKDIKKTTIVSKPVNTKKPTITAKDIKASEKSLQTRIDVIVKQIAKLDSQKAQIQSNAKLTDKVKVARIKIIDTKEATLNTQKTSLEAKLAKLSTTDTSATTATTANSTTTTK